MELNKLWKDWKYHLNVENKYTQTEQINLKERLYSIYDEK